MTAAIVPGSGAGRRMGTNKSKAFRRLSGKPLAYHAVRTLAAVGEIELIVLTVRPGEVAGAERTARRWDVPVKIVEGGKTRQESVFIALRELPAETKMTVIHDAARPLATPGLLRRVLDGAREHGACVPSIACEETVKLVRSGRVIETLNRDEIHIIQTPQAFYYDVLLEAHKLAEQRKWRVMDDATLVERMGRPVAAVTGERTNIKITRPSDMRLARLLIREIDRNA